MAYAWFEIVGMCTLAGILIVFAAKALDAAMIWVFDKIQARRWRKDLMEEKNQ